MRRMLALALVLAGCPVAIDDATADFTASLTGAQEVPPVTTTTTADARFLIHPDSNAVDFELDIRRGVNVLGASGAHLHCGEVGEPGPIVVPLAGAVVGGFDGDVTIEATIDDENIVDDSCGSTMAELIDAMFDGRVYINVHSTEYPEGLVRGQLVPNDSLL